jgi:TolB-like protein/Tfp pilus assembly protein PilF
MTIASGTRLGPYEVTSLLGAGGMGEVYSATDTRLDRKVAIKVLPERLANDPEALVRFEHEAKAVAALSHPNILAIHDVGREQSVSYVVLELLEGETLRDRLRRSPIAWRKAIETGMAIANGLAAAHDRGIIHRDIKPANVFLTSGGLVKILDFGLARTVEPICREKDGDRPTVSYDMSQDFLVGTINYMSPEQMRGLPGEAQSDIFSFGCVIYEMLTGLRAFDQDTDIETAAAILNEDAPGLGAAGVDVPAEVEQMIMRCLEKDPKQRFQSTRDLAFMLRALVGLEVGRPSARMASPPSQRPIESLVVLPLATLSGQPEQDYFTDGMTEALIADLAKIGALRVISRTSAMQYKGVKKPLPEIARELNVDAVVEGSVMRAGDRVRITAQLIEAATDQHLWAESYDRELRDILTLQSEVARAIAREIQIKLTPQEQARLCCVQQIDPEAHECYLMGRYHWNKRTNDALFKAIDYFQQAIEKDADFALAYAGVADCYNILGFYSLLPSNQAFPPAKAAAAKAMEIDDRIAEAHASLAFVKFYHDWEWAAAESEFRRAIQLNPGYATAHHWYAEYLVAMGQPELCIAEFKRAHELDPLSLIINAGIGWAYFYARHYDSAIEQCQKIVEMDPSFIPARLFLGQAFQQKAMYDEAIAEFRQTLNQSCGATEIMAELGHAYAVAGRNDEARQVLSELLELSERRHVSPYGIAIVQLGLRDTDQAFAWLEKAYAGRSHFMPLVGVDPRLDGLRSDPRFEDLLRRIGLPSASKATPL